MHSMHCVQFSGMKSGVSRRATYFDAVSPLAAAITPTEANVDDGWLYPKPARNSALKVATRVSGVRSCWPTGTGMERHPTWHASLSSKSGRSASPRNVDRSGASSSPKRISRTRSEPWVMTSIFEFTTASPSRPNFFTY